SNEPEVSVKLPNDASELKVDQVQYLNGILRIRLVKQMYALTKKFTILRTLSEYILFDII
ncbi:MAG: hypothetical protein WBL54_05955, partial [Nitrososphaeraceae archaeon]